MRILVPIALALLTACSDGTPAPLGPAEPASHPGDPYAYTTPTPARARTLLDGTYERRIEPEQAGGAGKCRRCPPYRIEASDQTLTFDRGVFRIANQIDDPKSIDWKSVGHYLVEGDRLTLFNDPNCTTARGTYRWRMTGGTLTLELLDDPCAFGGLRTRYLTRLPWERSG